MMYKKCTNKKGGVFHGGIFVAEIFRVAIHHGGVQQEEIFRGEI